MFQDKARKRTRTLVVVAILLAGIVSSCKGGHYSGKVGKLHSKMSSADVVAALGKPYGELNGAMLYYDKGADTMLAVQPDERGDCQWVLFEVPPSGPSTNFAYYKIRESGSAH